ncbi:Uncharacterised protein [Brevibacterium iodinum]|nr:Uncharacterised protein [Brevibacterium iodinum]
MNRALHTVITNRMIHDQRTKDYVAQRFGEDLTKKSKRELKRKLKWYLARRVFKVLNGLETIPTSA